MLFVGTNNFFGGKDCFATPQTHVSHPLPPFLFVRYRQTPNIRYQRLTPRDEEAYDEAMADIEARTITDVPCPEEQVDPE